MAKPIRATPTLTGEEAVAFLSKMKKNDSVRPTKADANLIKLMESNSKLFQI